MAARGAVRYGARESLVTPTRFVVTDRKDVCDDAIASYTGTVRPHPRYANQVKEATAKIAAAAAASGGDDSAELTGSLSALHAEPSVVDVPVIMDGRGSATMVDGRVYTGETRLGMFHGMGVMEHADGSVFDGQFEDHLPHGYGTLEGPMTTIRKTDADGEEYDKPVRSYSYVGLFRKGERDGQGDEVFQPSGDTFTGTFKDGKRSGVGRLNRGNGDVIDGVYKAGELEGLATVTYAHGDVFVCRYVNGKPHGRGEYTQTATGDKYIEEFDHGNCVFGVAAQNETGPGDMTECEAVYIESGARYRGGWRRSGRGSDRRGTREGHGTMVFPNGDRYEGDFEDDLMQGDGAVTYAAGAPQSGDFANEGGSDSDDDPFGDAAFGRREVGDDEVASANGSVGSEDLAINPSADDDAPSGSVGAVTAEQEDPFADMRNTTAFDDRDVNGVRIVRFEGRFHRGLRHGRGRLELDDGVIVEGFWERGRRDGVFHVTQPNAAWANAVRRDDTTDPDAAEGDTPCVGERVVTSEYYCCDVARPDLHAAVDLSRRVAAREVAARVHPVDFAVTGGSADINLSADGLRSALKTSSLASPTASMPPLSPSKRAVIKDDAQVSPPKALTRST